MDKVEWIKVAANNPAKAVKAAKVVMEAKVDKVDLAHNQEKIKTHLLLVVHNAKVECKTKIATWKVKVVPEVLKEVVNQVHKAKVEAAVDKVEAAVARVVMCSC